MTLSQPSSVLDDTDTTWREIDGLVESVSRLARSDVPPPQFAAGFLDRLVTALAAVAGGVWTRGPDGSIQLEYQVGLAETELHETAEHERLIEGVFRAGHERLVPPRSGGSDGEANRSEFLLLVCPVRLDGMTVAIVEVAQRADTGPAAQQGALRFLKDFCELAADYFRVQQLREFRGREGLWGRLEQFSQQVHASLDLDATAYVIANAGRPVIGCDRVGVAVFRSGRCRLLAVSGVETFDARANSVRRLEALATALAQSGEVLWYSAGEPLSLPPQIERPLLAYLDESPVRRLIVVPLREPVPAGEELPPPTPPVGVLIVECFEGGAGSELHQRIAAVCGHCALALKNAAEHQSLPLLPVLRAVGKARQVPHSRIVLCLLLVAALIAGLVLVPADFEIEARGELQPQHRREVFAPRDGLIEELPAARQNAVPSGGVLAVLRDPQLDLEFQRVWGEQQTAARRLAAVQAARLEQRARGSEGSQRLQQLAAEEEELKELLNSLGRQQELLKQQQTELIVRSPLAGQVLTWNIEQLLANRPVRRGQVLMTVADLDGPWALELHIPDHRAGHVLEAQQRGRDLEVSFILATAPGLTHRARIEALALATETRAEDGPSVLATVPLDRETAIRLRPGATVTARIHCGRRSIGYVWFHSLIEVLQARLWW